MVCLGKESDHSVIFEIVSKYYILNSFVDYDGYSTSSKGFLPTVVDIMVIWMGVHDIVQETGFKTISKKKKCKKVKWLSEKALQITEKKKGSEKQRRKGKIYPFECRVPKNSKER